MKKMIWILAIFLGFIISVKAVIIADNPKSSDTGNKTLTLQINNIKSDAGNIRIHIYNLATKEYFPKKTENCFMLRVENIIDKSCIVKIPLPSDTYCLSVHHDENANVSMDTNFFGLPKEGWGISNNVRLIMRLPKFDECSFRIEDKDTTINVNMRY